MASSGPDIGSTSALLDTKGYVFGREERFWVHAPAYRDWVVQAFNRDLPYDEFLLLQIAADQAAPQDRGVLGRRWGP